MQTLPFSYPAHFFSCSEWCGNSTFQESYAPLVTSFAQYNIVAYFSEFGCISSPPRQWTEVPAIFSSDMSEWSGGIAFSYYPAQSAAGQFGIVTISTDGSTVTTTLEYSFLQQQYSSVTFLNSPLESDIGSPTYPSCPANNSLLLASPTLPPTPNSTACNCVENNLSCQYTPPTNNDSAIVGELLNYGCSLLGGKGGTCNDISGNGTTGEYGEIAECDPSTSFLCIIN